MSETKFTKGPWIYEEGNICADAGMRPLAFAYPDDGHVNPRFSTQWPQRANGLLIATAPEMYEDGEVTIVELRDAIAALQGYEGIFSQTIGMLSARADAWEARLAKARGEEVV